MTEVILQMAEEHFVAHCFQEAYRTANTALKLDPYFGNGVIHKHIAAYRVHYAALCKNSFGEINWYEILGVDYSASMESITRRFHRMNEYIHPENHPSAAAKGAYELSGRAFKILGNPERRKAFHVRWNLPPPPDEQHVISAPTTTNAPIKPEGRQVISRPIRTEKGRAISRPVRKEEEGPRTSATPALKPFASIKFKKESHRHHAFGSSRFNG